MSSLIEHAQHNLDSAGISGPLREDVMELLTLFSKQDHNRVPMHYTADLFSRLAKSENLPSKAVRESVDLEPLLEGKPFWKRHALSKIRQNDFYEFPEHVRNQSAMWRMSSYKDFASDVIDRGGLEGATLLSLLFKPKVIVEMGLHAGFTTLGLCRLNPEARVYGVDINSRMPDADLPIAYAAWMSKVKNLSVSIMNSWEFKMPQNVELCFIDADHIGWAPWLDTLMAWENRNDDGDWCIAWDDYHPSNPDVKNAVDKFCHEVNMPLNVAGSWVWIGTKGAEELEEFQKA